MDVRCLFDKNQKLTGQQITYGGENLDFTTFPNNTLHLIGFGDFKNMFSINRYASDLYNTIKTEATR